MYVPPADLGKRNRIFVKPGMHGAQYQASVARTEFLDTVHMIMQSEQTVKQKAQHMAMLVATTQACTPDEGVLVIATDHIAALAQADIGWTKVLKNTEGRLRAKEAYDKEVKSLVENILTPLEPDTPEYLKALKESTQGRAILAEKRNGVCKSRVVKQGFKEDVEATDGPGFNYFSRCTRLTSVLNENSADEA